MILYRILLVIDALMAAILLFFFIAGLQDGSVSSFNIKIWLAMLGGVGLILWAGLHFGARRQYLPAGAILATLALPGLAVALFLLALLGVDTNWH
jgi:hypothetical protein